MSTVYILHYPAATTITLGGQASCQAFGGYHSNITLDANHGGADAAYAVIPRCTNFPPLTGVDAVTGSESHEIVEAVTDPYPQTQPAYAMVDDQHVYWARILGGGEVGDMCAQFPDVWNKYPDLPFTVQSSWSNKAAKAGHDPCVPAVPAGAPYFNAAPNLTENLPITVFGQTVTVKGVKIPVGMTKTIEVDLLSDGPTSGPWTVDVKDASSLFGGPKRLDVSVAPTSGTNGYKLALTITVLMAGKNNTETLLVTSKLGAKQNVWIGLVAN